jgi:hypothetical protein
MIVDVDGVAVRRPLPQFDGALVVSLAPEGYRLYPVDLEEARAGFEALAAFWKVKQRSPIGKPIASRKVKPSLTEAMSPVVAAYTPPDEGAEADAKDYADLQAKFEEWTSDHKLVMTAWVTQGRDAGRHWKLNQQRTERRLWCYRAAMALIETWDGNEDYTFACLRVILGDLQGTDTIGGLIGCLTIAQARQLEQVARLSSDSAVLFDPATGAAHWADESALRSTAA